MSTRAALIYTGQKPTPFNPELPHASPDLQETPTELQDDFEAKPALRLAHTIFDLCERGNGGVNQLAVGQFPVVVLMCCHLGLLGASIHTNSCARRSPSSGWRR
jgi:hypothetical protein